MIRRPNLLATLAFATASAALATGAHAQVTVGATAVIAPNAATSTTGAVAVNEAAGLNNAQGNQLTISSGGSVANVNLDDQSTSSRARLANATAIIGSGAFSNTSGAMMVNQAAGVGNIQRNSAQIGTGAFGVAMLSDGELSAVTAQNGNKASQAGQAGGIREVRIDGATFRNATGLVQVNQTAGAGNATANSFVLRPPAGTLF
ncbi:hypothetical protein [Paraburkholderia bannensis]|uniref:hypothetical protein n=1 Tax=Paraburkholderia bannensis TaxID=765414 RepID=UPI0005A88916|nr:hypothetical protein [Paraburkholderia bannensis]